MSFASRYTYCTRTIFGCCSRSLKTYSRRGLVIWAEMWVFWMLMRRP
jgi:hypothetical protein